MQQIKWLEMAKIRNDLKSLESCREGRGICFFKHADVELGLVNKRVPV